MKSRQNRETDMKGWGEISQTNSPIAKHVALLVLVTGFCISYASQAQAQQATDICNRELSANVVALDMPLMFNRLGAQNINGMMYALRGDVVSKSFPHSPIGDVGTPAEELALAGNVTLRPDKRPRPLVLRMGAGDCMTITLTNLLAVTANPFGPVQTRSGIDFNLNIDDQVAARDISLRFQGTELVNNISDDGSFVGENASSLVSPGATRTFTIYAPKDGAFLGVSYGGTIGGEGLGGQTADGLWAVLNVNAKGAAFYRSQLSNEDLLLSLDHNGGALVDGVYQDANFDGYVDKTGHPIINYEARYPNTPPWSLEGKGDKPIINMFDGTELVHTAIDAIVAYGGKDFVMQAPGTGPHASDIGHFPPEIYPLENVGVRNPTVPNRLEPFREFTVAFHDEVGTKQAFPKWFEDPVLKFTLHGVRDSFMINYGSGGIGSEIIANRLGVGPMHDCVNCAYEEFFLTSYTVGEVGQLTDIPANFGLEDCDPKLANCGAVGPKANYVLYPEDPSNIHHSYTGDAAAFRNLHAGPGEQHVFHLHNHQWLFNADDDNSNYLDAQGLGPGSGYAYWINFGGSGNRNKTAGDAIFHCHFYPHFAQGMWEMWRLHDAFEPGTELMTTVDNYGAHQSFTVDGIGIGNGTPAPDARALPDAEVIAGAPTPAVVPLPGKPMAPMPAAGVTVKENPNTVPTCVDSDALRVPRTSAGVCPTGIVVDKAVGSLTHVNRTYAEDSDGNGDNDTFGAYGADGYFGGGDDINPGYPFWIAGMEHIVGNRPPTPPLDMITNAQALALKGSGPLWSHPGFADAEAVDGWDGGLPRFAIEGYAAGGESLMAVTRLDMSKEVTSAKPVFFPEEGTDLEKVAMEFHAQRCHDSALPNGDAANCPDVETAVNPTGGFIANGALPVPGAPFQDPCIDDRGELMGPAGGYFFGGDLAPMLDTGAMTVHGASPHNAVNPRYYKAANVQFDAVFNKQGYHFPQQRITIKQERPPEPFVLRMNTFDCTQYVHSNVVPNVYELDDYQVRTPTDIIGQHIHLPKWDLTSADGSANGWNYEDGTLSPQAVVEMIHAINHWNTTPGNTPVTTRVDGKPVVTSDGNTLSAMNLELHASVHPFFGMEGYGANCTDEEWCGARSTLQRWFADPVVNVQGVDRGLGIIFTHDHYGPSTHQQVGLYATVLVEPAGSKWVHNEQGVQLGLSPDGTSPAGRTDGGPTSWQAAILTGSDGFGSDYTQNVKAEQVENYREFYFEYTDFQHAYQPGVFVGIGPSNLPITPHDIHTPWGSPDGMGGEILPDVIGVNGSTDIRQTFREAIQPPYRQQASLTNGFPVDIWEFPATCVGDNPNDPTARVMRPCPEAITADDPGMYVVNYRNESLAARVFDPDRPATECPDGKQGCQAEGKSGDLAFAMASNVHREISELNDKMGIAPAGYAGGSCTGGVFCPPINNQAERGNGDPFTPIMRANDGDRVHIKMQAGGQEEEHAAIMHGLKWLQGGSGFGEAKNSGWRNAQSAGISEQFALRTPVFADYLQRGTEIDYAYSFNASIDGWVNGTWGVLRSSKKSQNLYNLPNNDATKDINVVNKDEFEGVCPKSAPKRYYDITAVAANDVLGAVTSGVTVQDLFPGTHAGASPDGDGSLIYNPRTTTVAGTAEARGGEGPLHDPTALIYVNTDDLVAHDAYPDFYKKKKKYVHFWNSDDPYCNSETSGVQHRLPGCAVKLRQAEPYTDENYNGQYDPGEPYIDMGLTSQSTAGPNGVYDGAVPLEPIVIRANAGDCIEITLRNKVLSPATYTDWNGEHRVYRDWDILSPAFFYSPEGYEYVADLNDDGVLDVLVDSVVTEIDWDQTLDLATGNAIAAYQRRDPGSGAQGMTSFQSNLMQPSAHVGLLPQLVEYDVSRGDGTNVGGNPAQQSVVPGGQETYKWYAGKIEMKTVTASTTSTRKKKRGNTVETRNVELVATPIEFGGFNLMPTDKIEQGQKGLVGAAVIYPQGSTWTVDSGRTTAATVIAPINPANPEQEGIRTFRDFTTVAVKGASMFYADSYPVENLLGEEDFGIAEDAQDMGHMNINYGNEAMWFRYGKNPTAVGGNAMCAGLAPGDCLGGVPSEQAAKAFSNTLENLDGVGGPIGDPETAVFQVKPGEQFRMHVLMPFSPGRGSTYDLHGHVWQRDPYVCPGDTDLGLDGKCDMVGTDPSLAGLPGSGSVGSQNLGESPIGFHLGGIESWFSGQHYEIVIPSAGGSNGVPGDYLFRDHMGLGNAGGLWGIVRVDPNAPSASQ
jgi:hypothetical protein